MSALTDAKTAGTAVAAILTARYCGDPSDETALAIRLIGEMIDDHQFEGAGLTVNFSDGGAVLKVPVTDVPTSECDAANLALALQGFRTFTAAGPFSDEAPIASNRDLVYSEGVLWRQTPGATESVAVK